MRKNKSRDLVVLGAQARLEQLNEEREELLRRFPELSLGRSKTARKASKAIRKERRVSTRRGFKYPKGQHWTQKPENAARKVEAARKSAETRQKTNGSIGTDEQMEHAGN